MTEERMAGPSLSPGDAMSEFEDIGGIVLDAVGTLIEASPSVAVAYAEAARRQGVEVDPGLVRERFRQHFGADEADELRGALSTDEARERDRWRRLVGLVLPELPDPARGFDELWGHFARPDAWRCFDDVPAALDALERAGVAVRIGSNFDGRLRSVVAGLPALAGRSGGVVISSEVGVRKPHPGFYRAAVASLGLPAGRVLFVGDDPGHDVEGPRRLGLRAALIDRDGRHSDTDAPRFDGLGRLVAAVLGVAPGPAGSPIEEGG
ncbi:MAG TPA: HAD family hydrolase [Isosphaeraceae bacterium]|jgi:putative hydrolase of the HAD superfamily|nr:HAD family hydrolase [Isosphaeraceae bacterium]